MKRFIFFLIWVAIAGLVGVYLVHNHGSLIVTFNDTMIRMPLWLFVLAVIIALLVLKVIYRFLAKIFGFPSSISRGFYKRRQKKSIIQLKKLLQNFVTGDWSGVEKYAAGKADGKSIGLDGEMSYFAVKAQLEQDNFLQAQAGLKDFPKENRSSEMFYWLSATTYIGLDEYDRAIKVLEKAQASFSSSFTINCLYFKALLMTKRYSTAVKLLDKMRRLKGVDDKLYKHFEFTAYKGSLLEASMVNPLKVNQSWEIIPSALKKNREIIFTYINALFEQGQSEEANRKIGVVFKKNAGKEFIPLLEKWDFNGKENDLLRQILAVKLINMTSLDYLNIAKVYLKLKEYKSAATYIQKSCEIKESISAYVLLAETYNRQNLLAQEAECYEKLHKII